MASECKLPPTTPSYATRKRPIPGTPEPTPSKRRALTPAFSTPNQTATPIARSSPRPPAHSPAPHTPLTTPRPVGLFGAQARKLARGRQESLVLNENDLPASQALPLYQDMRAMIDSLPALVIEPVKAIAARLDAVAHENMELRDVVQDLKARVDQLTVGASVADSRAVVNGQSESEQAMPNDAMGIKYSARPTGRDPAAQGAQLH